MRVTHTSILWNTYSFHSSVIRPHSHCSSFNSHTFKVPKVLPFFRHFDMFLWYKMSHFLLSIQCLPHGIHSLHMSWIDKRMSERINKWILSKRRQLIEVTIRNFGQDDGVGKHISPCTTTSQLQLNYRTTIIQNCQKLCWMEVLQLWN